GWPRCATSFCLAAPNPLPAASQHGVRWAHVGRAIQSWASFYDGSNHLPNLEMAVTASGPASIVIRPVYPPIRTYGADAVIPTRWFTFKGEAAYFTSASIDTEEYVLYVLQLERQTGEWILVGGYAGQTVATRRAALTFAPDRGLTRSIVARASYTI